MPAEPLDRTAIAGLTYQIIQIMPVGRAGLAGGIIMAVRPGVAAPQTIS